ncbi:MAG: hypothetical protein M3619_00800 [Myxococcota bacterium]|nr:hypothetical protein [Myxococcota bacterium]
MTNEEWARLIPSHLRESLDRYRIHGIPTGGCLRAVLAGDLFAAFESADPTTTAAMPAIARYVRTTMPNEIYGSHAIVDAWIAAKLEELRS